MRLANDPNYQRLDLSGRTIQGKTTYWLGADHLLIVEVTAASERYRRVRYEDMVAGYWVATARRMWWSILWGLVFVFGAGWVTVSVMQGTPDNLGTTVVFAVGIVAGVSGLTGMVFNVLRGRGGVCYLDTGVAVHALPGVVREPRAMALFGALRERAGGMAGVSGVGEAEEGAGVV